MTPVVSVQTMRHLEEAIFRSGVSEQEMMETAGLGVAKCAQAFILKNNLARKVLLLCGKGNNAGDAFVAGRHLINEKFEVLAVQKETLPTSSKLCQLNAKKFQEVGGVIVSSIPLLFHPSLILDGILGTGFKGAVKSPHSELILEANQLKIPIFAIDIPSGLDGTTGEACEAAILAKETIYLGLPKAGFFLNQGWNYTGKLSQVSLEIPDFLIDNLKSEFFMSTHALVSSLLPKIVRNRHKYQAGLVLGWGGSPSMPGAPLLASLASLRGGSGITKLLYPQGMETELSNSPYELIKIPYAANDPNPMFLAFKKANAAFIGPGLGTSEEVVHLLKAIVPTITIPLVLDADALNAYAKHPFPLPKQVVLTPHSGELERLMGPDFSFKRTTECLQRCQDFAERLQVTLVVKGAPTFIFSPHQPIVVNSTGSPGMATAGSGDVLTGLIAALLAQGLSTRDAAISGVFLHGLAGESAEEERGSCRGMIATDLIRQFSNVFSNLSP